MANALLDLLYQFASADYQWDGNTPVRLQVIIRLREFLFHDEYDETTTLAFLRCLLVLSSSDPSPLGSRSFPDDAREFLTLKLREIFTTFTLKVLKLLLSFVTAKQLQGLPTGIIDVIEPVLRESLLREECSDVLEELDKLFSHFLQQEPSKMCLEHPIRYEDQNQERTLKTLIDLILWRLDQDPQFGRPLRLEELPTSWLDLVENELAKKDVPPAPAASGQRRNR
jgi:hypothetical protein